MGFHGSFERNYGDLMGFLWSFERNYGDLMGFHGVLKGTLGFDGISWEFSKKLWGFDGI